MAQYQTSQDIGTRALKKAGEPTNGNSSYSESMFEYLSDVQRKLVAGASVFDVNVDEVWPWARAEQPVVIEMPAPYRTGTLSLTYGSNAGVFSNAPTVSLAGWFFRNTSTDESYRIAYHTAASVNFTLETPFLGTTNALFPFEAYKLDYEILPPYIYVTEQNNAIAISEDGTTGLPVTITPGAYTPTTFAAAWQTAMNTAAAATITVTYSALTRLFTFSSNGATFQILGERGSNLSSGMSVAGFDFKKYSGALTYTGHYPFGALSRIIAPIRYIENSDGIESEIFGVDPLTFEQTYTYRNAEEGRPGYFTKIKEDNSGKITIRLSSFPELVGRMQVSVCPVPVDLQNTASSVPLLPPKYYPFLEAAAVYYLLVEKEDSKKDEYYAMAKGELLSMQKHYRGELFRANGLFGYVAPRQDTSARGPWHRRLRYGYDKDNY